MPTSRAGVASFLAVCALAGALAVPWSPVATPAAATISALLGSLGLAAARWAGLPRRPAREGAEAARPAADAVRFLLLGVGMGLVVLAVLRFAIQPAVPAIGTRIAAAGLLPWWRRALIIFVAAVTEEIVFRLVLFSLFAGIAARLLRRSGAGAQRVGLWAANLLSAVAFGLAHLPSWTGVAGACPALAAAVVALNATAGLVLGHVYASRGIGPAMLTHAGGDVAVQLIGPLTG